jgi:serine/threonine protein kinase/tetratricopeptide (TPR) repeat protein
MGEVYRAWDPTLERSVALKALHPGGASEAGAPERFRREALALAQLNHPNVCQVHDWVESPAGTFIAMELVEGRTLELAAPELKVHDKLRVLRSVALALEAAHAKGLVHRDLKPGNIMVAFAKGDPEPRVKVLDFGLARLADPHGPGEAMITPPAVPNLALLRALEAVEAADNSSRQETTAPKNRADPTVAAGSGSWERLTQVGTFMGSPSYASPEQIQGQAAGPSSDVFSLGIVAWELLAGEHPFPGEGRARMRAILDGSRWELKVRGLPSGTADLLRAMLEAHPFKRPTAARVSETLGRLLKPHNLLRWTAASVAGALLLTGGVNWFLSRGIIADLSRQRPARLVVLPFLNQTGDPKMNAVARLVLPEMLESLLREHPKLAPIDLESVAKTRGALRLPTEGALSPGDLARLSAALGTQLILRGTLTKAAGSFGVTYELSDARGTVRQAGEARESGDGNAVSQPLARQMAGDIFKAVDPFASRTRGGMPSVPPQAMDAYTLGREAMDHGDFNGAAPAFQAASQGAPDFTPAILGYARCLSHLADAPPEPVFLWALWATRAQGLRANEMKILEHLATYYGSRGHWEASDRACREALSLARALGAEASEAGAHNTFGANFYRRHKPVEAEAEYRQALALFQAIGDKQDAYLVLINLAVIERERGDLRDAEARYLEALTVVQSYGDRWGEAIVTNNLGELALSQEGGLDRAEARFHQAQAMRGAIGDQSGLAYTLMGLASVAQARGELDRAEGLMRQFLEQARKTRLRPMEALAFYNLGEVNRAATRYEAARGFYRQSLALHQELKDSLMEAHCLAGEAECLARDRHPGMARALLERSRLLSADETPYILRAQAWLARSEGHADAARGLFGRALDAARIQAPEIVRELRAATR